MLTPPPLHADALLAELHASVSAALGAQEVERLQVARAVLGLFFTGVQLDNGIVGLCATPLKSIPQAVCCPSSAQAMPVPGKLIGRSAAELLQDLYRPQALRRTLAIATLNALAETLWQRDGPPPGVRVQAGDAFDALAIAPGERVALVGAFPPYMRRLRQAGQPFTVLELDPATLKAEELPYYRPAHQAPEVLAQCDALITTGTTLVNDSLDGLLAHLRPGARAAVVGPSATLLAAPFARRGVRVVGGTRVLQPQGLLDLLAEGGSGYHFFDKAVQRVCLCW